MKGSCFPNKSPPDFWPDLNLTNDPLCHVSCRILQGFIRLDRRDGDDERKSISGRKQNWRSEQAYISSTPGRALRTGGRLGGFLSLLSDFCLARGAAVLGVENLILFSPPPWRRSRSLGCPSTLNERRMCV